MMTSSWAERPVNAVEATREGRCLEQGVKDEALLQFAPLSFLCPSSNTRDMSSRLIRCDSREYCLM